MVCTCNYVFSFLVTVLIRPQQPAGYSDAISGLLGATLLLAGIVAAVVSAPLFDRVFTHRIGATLKILVPIVSAAWLSLIWAGQW